MLIESLQSAIYHKFTKPIRRTQLLLSESRAWRRGQGVVEEFDGVVVMVTLWPTSLGVIEPATERWQ